MEDFRTKGERYDVIFDAVGKITKTSCKYALEKNGKYITVSGGNATERIEDLRLLKEIAQDGKYMPVIDRTYPLVQIVEAYTYVDTGHKTGNVIITL